MTCHFQGTFIELYDTFVQKTPKLGYFRIWSCQKVVKLLDPNWNTLGERGYDCTFIGYVENSNTYKLYVIDPNDSKMLNTITESRDAIFIDPKTKYLIYNSKKSQNSETLEDK